MLFLHKQEDSDGSSEKIGFIGLGTMGLPMARNLRQRHGITLNVWNRTQKAPVAFPGGCDVEIAPITTDRFARVADVHSHASEPGRC